MTRALPSVSELSALAKVHAALRPLDPERRRRVIEAVHALLEISAGAKQNHDGPPQAEKSRRRR